MATRPETPRPRADAIERQQDLAASDSMGVDGWPDRKALTARIQQAIGRIYPGWTLTVRVESRTPTQVVLIIDARNSAVPPPLLSAAQAEKIAQRIDTTLEALVSGWDFIVSVTLREPGHVEFEVHCRKGIEGDPPVSADGSPIFDSEKPGPNVSPAKGEPAICRRGGMELVLTNPSNKKWLFVQFAPGASVPALSAAFIPKSPGGAGIVNVHTYPAPWSTWTPTLTAPTVASVVGWSGTIQLTQAPTFIVELPKNQDFVICVAGLGQCRMWW